MPLEFGADGNGDSCWFCGSEPARGHEPVLELSFVVRLSGYQEVRIFLIPRCRPCALTYRNKSQPYFRLSAATVAALVAAPIVWFTPLGWAGAATCFVVALVLGVLRHRAKWKLLFPTWDWAVKFPPVNQLRRENRRVLGPFRFSRFSPPYRPDRR
jgi:hypothetical protein